MLKETINQIKEETASLFAQQQELKKQILKNNRAIAVLERLAGKDENTNNESEVK